jgi:hypothetical protein
MRVACWKSKATCKYAHAHAHAPGDPQARTHWRTQNNKLSSLIFLGNNNSGTPLCYVVCSLSFFLLLFDSFRLKWYNNRSTLYLPCIRIRTYRSVLKSLVSRSKYWCKASTGLSYYCHCLTRSSQKTRNVTTNWTVRSSNSGRGQEMSLFCKMSRSVLTSTQHSIPWLEGPLPGVLRPGREVYHAFLYSAEIKNEWSYTSTSPYMPL